MITSRKKIAISGATGQLGRELQVLAQLDDDFEYHFLQRPDFDLEKTALLANQVRLLDPDFFINCGAYTAVDKAESESDPAFLINADAPGIIAATCKEIDCRFIHISTDYVFDGNSQVPYKEDDATEPVTVYGASKQKGETEVLRYNNEAVIIRTSWVYSGFGKNFLLTMLRLFAENQQVNVVSDQFGTPTNAADLAAAIMHIVRFPEWKPGIYHYSNEGVATWFEFAQQIALLVNTSCILSPITTREYPTPARRPAYSVLDKQKIRETFDLEILPWKESLGICMNKIKKARH